MTPRINGKRIGGRHIDLDTFQESAMTVNEAARVLTVNRSTIEKWCANGDLQLLALPGGIRRVTTTSVRALLRKSTKPPA